LLLPASGSSTIPRAGASTPTPKASRLSFRAVLTAVALLLLTAGAQPGALAQSQASDLADLRRQAEQLRREQRLPEALAAYRRVVAEDPRSFEDRFWVAKLEGWTGDLPAADRGFGRLLAERPDDYDTRVALADVRLWRGDTAATRELLTGLRLEYPADAEVRRRIEALEHRVHSARWEADFEYYGERLSGGAAASGAALSLATRPHERFRWRAVAGVQEKFERTEPRAGGEIGLRFGPRVELVGSVAFAPGAEVLPRGSYGAGASHLVARGVVLSADYAFLDYLDAGVHQAGPAVEVYAGPCLVAGRVRWAATSFAGSAGAVHDGAASLSLGRLYGPGNLVRVFAGTGSESFTQPSREQVGRFDARTIGLSWRHYVTPGLGLEALYAHQDRSGGAEGDSWSLRVLHRW
jgi:YaiO family outer membrane protein